MWEITRGCADDDWTLTFALELKDGVCILQAGDGSVTCFIWSRVLHGVLKGFILYYSNPIDMKCPLPFSLSFLVDDLVVWAWRFFLNFCAGDQLKVFFCPYLIIGRAISQYSDYITPHYPSRTAGSHLEIHRNNTLGYKTTKRNHLFRYMMTTSQNEMPCKYPPT